MNYYTLRIMILVILIIIYIIIDRLLIKKYSKNINRIKFFILLILYIFVWSIPYEKSFMKFTKTDQIFSYYFPYEKKSVTYEFDDYVYVFYSKYSSETFFIRKNGYLTYEKNQSQVIWKRYEKYVILITKIKFNNAVCINIIYPIDVGKTAEISDSLSSNFDSYNEEFTKNMMITYKVAILNKKIDDNYTLYFDGEAYKPFKWKNYFYNS